jgi:hypothetical protein
MTDTFIILRKEHDSYRSIGPLSHAVTLEKARAQIATLAGQYPQQEFRIFADVGGATCQEIVTIDLQSPDMTLRPAASISPMRRKDRAA